MLESAEIGHRVSKRVYAREEPKLREALLNAQYDLAQSRRGPTLLIMSGVERGGRGETANKLTEWMDPRHIRVLAFGPRLPEEATRPPAWRYWRSLPPKGRIGIFMNAWYDEVVLAHSRAKLDSEGVHAHLQAIREHEQMLTDEGFVLLKFWIHLSKAAQKKRLQDLEADPRTRMARHARGLERVPHLQPSRMTGGRHCCGRPRRVSRRGMSLKESMHAIAT